MPAARSGWGYPQPGPDGLRVDRSQIINRKRNYLNNDIHKTFRRRLEFPAQLRRSLFPAIRTEANDHLLQVVDFKITAEVAHLLMVVCNVHPLKKTQLICILDVNSLLDCENFSTRSTE